MRRRRSGAGRGSSTGPGRRSAPRAPRPRRSRGRAGGLRAVRPQARIVPAVGRSSPTIMRAMVVLPEPDSPTIASDPPAGDLERDVVDGEPRRRTPCAGRRPRARSSAMAHQPPSVPRSSAARRHRTGRRRAVRVGRVLRGAAVLRVRAARRERAARRRLERRQRPAGDRGQPTRGRASMLRPGGDRAAVYGCSGSSCRSPIPASRRSGRRTSRRCGRRRRRRGRGRG